MPNTQAPSPVLQSVRPFKKIGWMSPHSRRYLAVLCVLMTVTTAINFRAELLGTPAPSLVALLQFSMGLPQLMWMRADARLRGSPIPGGGLLAAAVLLPIAVPSYILWTRRWWGLVVIGVSLVAVLAAAIVGVVAVYLAMGVPIVL